LDEVPGGGLPEYSFNLIAGAPGTGKTTLSQQIMFALALPSGRPCISRSWVSRHSRCCAISSNSLSSTQPRVGTSVHYVNLSNATLSQGLEAVLETIQREVEQVSPGIVVVDSFRTIMRAADGGIDLQGFLERLAIQLTSWQATTFLVGEYPETEVAENAILPLPTASCGCTSTSTATLACASSRR